MISDKIFAKTLPEGGVYAKIKVVITMAGCAVGLKKHSTGRKYGCHGRTVSWPGKNIFEGFPETEKIEERQYGRGGDKLLTYSLV